MPEGRITVVVENTAGVTYWVIVLANWAFV